MIRKHEIRNIRFNGYSIKNIYITITVQITCFISKVKIIDARFQFDKIKSLCHSDSIQLLLWHWLHG